MLELPFGQALPGSSNQYLRVKQKGDKVTFRLAQNPVYVGKHFIQTKDGWDISLCERINDGEKCSYCELFFQALEESKKLKDSKPEEAKEWERESRKYAPSTTFYFPVLNRDNESFQILQTTAGVRNKLNAQHDAGIDVFKRDWILRNTGSSTPAEIYSLTPVDSADSPEFSDKEVEEFEKAKNFDRSSLNDGVSNVDEIET